jgi:hypothetical protein
MQIGANLGLPDVDLEGQDFDVIAMSGQLRLQVVQAGRQHTIDDLDGDGFLSDQVGLLEGECQVLLNLQGRCQGSRQALDGLVGDQALN